MPNLLVRHLRDAPVTSCPSDPHRSITHHPATASSAIWHRHGHEDLVCAATPSSLLTPRKTICSASSGKGRGRRLSHHAVTTCQPALS